MEVFTLNIPPPGFLGGIQTTVTTERVISGSETNHNLENEDSSIYPSYSCNISDSQTIRERVESGSLLKHSVSWVFFRRE